MKNGPSERKWNIFPIGLSKERSWKARYGILDGRDQFPTVQGTIVGLPSSYQATAVTPPPSIDRGIRASEGDRGGSPELVHSRAVFFPGSTNRDPVKKTKFTFPPSQIPQGT